MSIPVNIDAANAIDIASLPYSNSQSADDLGTTYPLWYKYTAAVGENYIGIWGWGGGTGDPNTEYAPYVNVYINDGVTFYVPNSSSTFPNRPIIIPVTPGTTYYFQFISISGNYTPSNFAINVITGPEPTTYVPLGALFVNDDGDITQNYWYGAAFLSAIDGDDNNLYRFLYPFVSGEGGDVLQTAKVYLFEDLESDQCILYDSQLVQITTVGISRGAGQRIGIRANQTSGRFHTIVRSNSSGLANEVHRVTDAGVPTLIFSFVGGADAFAVNDNESLVYIGGKAGGTDSSVVTWNGSIFSAFIPTVASFAIRDMLWLGDGTLLVMYVSISSPRDVIVKRFNNAGALQNTYTLVTAQSAPSIPFGYRLAFALDDPTSFWAWWHKNDPVTNDQGTSIFQNVRVSDGSILAEIEQVEYQRGTYSLAITAIPQSRFGNSSSCPFVVLVEAIGTPPPTPTGTIRVIKVTNPSEAAQIFDFTTVNLDPEEFSLEDGESRDFEDLEIGDGYGVAETPVAGWTTVYNVSNGSPIDNISVMDGELVIVTVTNTQAGIPTTSSGIYEVVPGKRQDTLYTSFGPPITTQDVKIP